MNPPVTTTASRLPAKRRWPWLLVAALWLLFVVAALGVTSYFRFGSDTKALRDGVIKSSGVDWRQRIGIHVGGFTLCAVRAGLSFVHLDAEARAALRSVNGVQIGVYQLPPGVKSPERVTMLAAADHAVANHGWNRVVCVLNGQKLVTVYVQDKTTWLGRIKCLVMVFDGHQMVMVAAQGNPEPLVRCLLNRPDVREKLQRLAKR